MVRPQLADRVHGLESIQAKIKNKRCAFVGMRV